MRNAALYLQKYYAVGSRTFRRRREHLSEEMKPSSIHSTPRSVRLELLRQRIRTVMNGNVARAAALVLAVACVPHPAQARCIDKSVSQSGFEERQAIALAWETILQEIDWQLQIKWLSESLPAGVAPGYQVKNYRIKCLGGGDRGHICTVSATLCK